MLTVARTAGATLAVAAAAALSFAAPASADRSAHCPDGFSFVPAAAVRAAAEADLTPVVVGSDHNGEVYGLVPEDAAAVVADYAGATTDACVSVPRKQIMFITADGDLTAASSVDGLPGYIVADDGRITTSSQVLAAADPTSRPPSPPQPPRRPDPTDPAPPGEPEPTVPGGPDPTDPTDPGDPTEREPQPTVPGTPPLTTESPGAERPSLGEDWPAPLAGRGENLPDWWQRTNRSSAAYTLSDRLEVVHRLGRGDEAYRALHLCPQRPDLCSAALDADGVVERFRADAASKTCSQGFYGGEQMTVRGSIDGESFSFSLNRRDGCEEYLWALVAEPSGWNPPWEDGDSGPDVEAKVRQEVSMRGSAPALVEVEFDERPDESAEARSRRLAAALSDVVGLLSDDSAVGEVSEDLPWFSVRLSSRDLVALSSASTVLRIAYGEVRAGASD